MGDRKNKSGAARATGARPKRRRPLMRKAYLCECPVCGNGLVRFWKFRHEVVGLCDECELFWKDLGSLRAKPRGQADGTFPGSSDKNGQEVDWKRATRRDVERAGMGAMVGGYSD